MNEDYNNSIEWNEENAKLNKYFSNNKYVYSPEQIEWAHEQIDGGELIEDVIYSLNRKEDADSEPIDSYSI